MNRYVLAAGLVAMLLTSLVADADAQELLVEKKVFEIPSFTTQSGRVLRNVRIGWESYGTLNADKSNAILINPSFAATSHAAGKYSVTDTTAGYWDAIIGPGKAIDTDKYYVLSADTLVNINVHDPKVVTTGPATINPDTGKQYGMSFPIVTIRDFVETQKLLAESLGIRRFHMVGGPGMGAMQAYEWAAVYPEMVGRLMPVVGYAEADANFIAWLDVWSAPIRSDPRWNGGDYYASEPPLAGLAEAMKIFTLHTQHWRWANTTFGRKWAKEAEDPAKSFSNRFAVEAVLDNAGSERAKVADANHFLYMAKANQVFVVGGGTLDEGLKRIKAPTLLITQPDDLLFPPEGAKFTVDTLKAAGTPVEHVTLKGNRGHLDGVINIKQAEKAIGAFVAK